MLLFVILYANGRAHTPPPPPHTKAPHARARTRDGVRTLASGCTRMVHAAKADYTILNYTLLYYRQL